ncbi:MAG: chlorophyll synthesis pathway protein BchC, partial [Betaproteobacteria bacterium]|nr:chlorophyll synthesis pathway protein BchC [Betaproteobacteria bacterium]
MQTLAVVMEKPQCLRLDRVGLSVPGEQDLLVEIGASGISTGTEKLLWTGRMPHFPGMGYPLIPGYESVGRVLEAGRN